MKDLLVWLGDKLDNICDTVYEDLERDDVGKVIIDDIKLSYYIPTVQNVNLVKKQIPVEIDVWGRCDQVLEIENITDIIDKALNRELINVGNKVFYIVRSFVWINNLKDTDKKIKRRKLNYNIRLYKE